MGAYNAVNGNQNGSNSVFQNFHESQKKKIKINTSIIYFFDIFFCFLYIINLSDSTMVE